MFSKAPETVIHNAAKTAYSKAAPIGVSSHFGDLTEVSDAVTYARIAMSAARPDGSMLTVFESDPLAIAAVSAPRVMKRISSAVFAGFADLDAHERETLVATFCAWMACGGSVNTTAETAAPRHAEFVRSPRTMSVTEIASPSKDSGSAPMERGPA